MLLPLEQLKLVQPFVFCLLLADILLDALLVQARRRNIISLARKFCPVKFCRLPMQFRAIDIALFPLIYPTTWATEYFGGISINTWI
jgi:hypothetical protein